MAEDPWSCYFEKENVKFMVIIAKHAATVEEWTCCVKQKFPDNTHANCVELDYKYTDTPRKVYQRYLSLIRSSVLLYSSYPWRTRRLSIRYIEPTQCRNFSDNS